MAAVAGVITIGTSVGISIALRLQSWFGAPDAAFALNLISGLVAYFLPLFILIAFIWAFASLPVTNEKVNGNIECLLATPLGPKVLWMGKGLAVFLPSYIISLIASCIVLLAVNFAAILPGWDTFMLPGPAMVNGLVVNPLLFFALLSFIVLFSLANNPDIAIAPSFLIGFGLMIGIPVGLATGIIDINSWYFTLWYLAGTAAAWIIVLYLARLLTRQNIVLSSKGS
jgi:ABC-2 type transport system permease protein